MFLRVNMTFILVIMLGIDFPINFRYDSGMAKKKLQYPEQINFLTVAGTIEKLVAIAFYRGDRGVMGSSARDMMSIGIENFISALHPADKKRFNEILDSVRAASAIKRDSHLDQRRGD